MAKMKKKKTPKKFEARSLSELYDIAFDIFIQLVSMKDMSHIEVYTIICILNHLYDSCGD